MKMKSTVRLNRELYGGMERKEIKDIREKAERDQKRRKYWRKGGLRMRKRIGSGGNVYGGGGGGLTFVNV
jgi:hypothetical protein